MNCPTARFVIRLRRPRARAGEERDVTVERLEAEMRCIRETLDRLQDDFAWSLNNDPAREDTWRPASAPIHITSLARDPLAADFGERIDKVPAEELAALREQVAVEAEEKAIPPTRSGSLF